MSEKVHWKKVVSDPTYIGEADFEPGEEKVLTIASVNTKETVMSAEGKSTKAVVHWVEPEKAMILNVARSKAIQKATGSPWIDDWCGKKVQLYIDNKVKAFGEIVSAVRVRNFPPKAQPKQDTKADGELICENCGKPITAAYGMSAAEVAASTKAKFKRMLCKDCAVSENEKRKVQDG